MIRSNVSNRIGRDVSKLAKLNAIKGAVGRRRHHSVTVIVLVKCPIKVSSTCFDLINGKIKWI
jgi:hypothetical protein